MDSFHIQNTQRTGDGPYSVPRMDHFLSGLDSHNAWYNPRGPFHSQAHEFAVGTRAGVIATNSTVTSANASMATSSVSNSTESYKSSAAVSAAASVASAAAAAVAATMPKLKTHVKEEDVEGLENRFAHMEGIPMGTSKSPKKNKNGSKEDPWKAILEGKEFIHYEGNYKGNKWDAKKICNICGKTLSRGDKLKNHIRIHTNNFPFHCDTCGQGFLRSEGLRIHTRIHTGERPYVCVVCGKAYTRKDKLTRHAIVHTGERPFVCQHCGKSFTRKDKMQRHELIHKVEKPWTCVPCNLEFVRQEGFNAHMEKKHPERLQYTLIQHPRLIENPPSPSYLLPERMSPLTPASTSSPSASQSPNPGTSSGLIASANSKSLALLTSRLPASLLPHTE